MHDAVLHSASEKCRRIGKAGDLSLRMLAKPRSAITRSAPRASTYLKNGGTLERKAAMAKHTPIRATQLYDRRRDELTLDEVERNLI